MAILTADDITVSEAAGDRLRLTIRDKSHFMPPEVALVMSNRLGNLAADLRPSTSGYVACEEVHLLPFREDGKAALRFMTDEGPVIIAIDSKWLSALAAAANAALELSDIAGEA